jgi:glyoxylase-like metal-dependent hydrolase (beta-lactamase superfamily II)
MRLTTVEGGLVHVRLTTPATRALGFGASVWLLDDTLVDAGFPHAARGLRRALADRPVAQVLVTHAHEDHFGNAAWLAARGAVVRAPAAGLRVMREPHRLHLRPYQRVLWGRPAPVTAVALPAGGEVAAGQRRLVVVPTPGHAPDHVAFFEPERGWLFAGDLFLGVKVRAARPFENVTDLLASLRRVRALAPRLLLCAHRGVVRDPLPQLDAKIAWLAALHDGARRLRDQGLPPAAIRGRLSRGLLGRETLRARLITGGDFSGAWLVRGCLEEPGTGYDVPGSIAYDRDEAGT